MLYIILSVLGIRRRRNNLPFKVGVKCKGWVYCKVTESGQNQSCTHVITYNARLDKTLCDLECKSGVVAKLSVGRNVKSIRGNLVFASNALSTNEYDKDHLKFLALEY